MKAMKPQSWRVSRNVVRIALLVMIILQVSVLTASASKFVFVAWGKTSSFSGDGGSISANGSSGTGFIVSNGGNLSPKAGNSETVTFTLTPITGYVVDTVQWKNGSNSTFTSGGTTLTPSGNQVSITLTGSDCAFQVRFKVDPNAAQNSFLSYYGTGAIDTTGATAPNWIGGNVARSSGGSWNPLGTSSYTVDTYSSSNVKTVRITPTTSPAYTVAAVQYCEATWNDPRSITVTTGTCVPASVDGSGQIFVTAASPKNYIIFVQFQPIGAVGGKVGAWYGTNNAADYDATTATPPGANGSGGTVWKTSPGSSAQLSNRVADGASISSNTNVTIEVRPANNFKISYISYGDTSPTNPVTVPANQTSNMSFTFPVAGGHNYVVWVVFTSTAASSFTVSGTVDSSTDPSCTSNSINPSSQIININQTGSFVLSTSTNCTIESVNFNNTGAQAWVGSGTTYTTGSITATSSFVVKFKPIGYNIVAEIDSNSPTGCGATISPTGTINAVRGSNTTFVFSSSATCAVSHVWVTDTNRGYSTDTDIAPVSASSYTFTNLQAPGHIKVQYSSIVPTSSDAYCQIPPFVAGQSGLAPNVLIIFDNSGSMGGNDSDGYAYYNRTTYDCTSTSTLGTCKNFYGYFDPATMYKADSSDSNKYIISSVSLALSTSGSTSGSTTSYSGNYLNYRYMHKVDIVRKVLTGGKVVSRTATNYFLAADIGKTIEFGTTLPTGLLQRLADKVRFGMMVFNNPPEGGHLANVPSTTRKAVLGSSLADLIAVVESSETDPKTSTPIAETLYEAIRYFQAKPSAYNSGVDYGTMDPIQNNCQKNFILLLTDGEPNNNNNLPGLNTYPTLNNYTDSVFDVTTWENRIPANDRASTSNSSCSSVTYGNSTNSEKVEAVAFYAHNTDLRSDVYGNNKDGVQNITIFPVYAFGDGSGTKTLQMTAKYGGYENKNGNAPSPNTWPSPDQQSEWDHLTDATRYDCVPYNYFEATDGSVLEASLYSAMDIILAKVTSGTAASILSNSEGSGANLLQAVYYSSKIFENSTEAKWIGELQNLWFYIDPYLFNSTVREDTDFSTTTPNHILNLQNDLISNVYFDGTDTKVDLLKDTVGDGKTLTSVCTGCGTSLSLDSVHSIWRAGKQLQARTAESRTIHTSIDGLTLLTPTTDTAGTATVGGFYTNRAASLRPYLQAANNDSLLEANSIINYVRGDDQPNYRTRKVSFVAQESSTNWKEWKLGDIVSSTPQLQSSINLNNYQIDYNDTTYGKFISSDNYRNRGMVYVGANDGMLHAFKLGKLTVKGDTGIPSGSSTLKISGLNKAALTGGTNMGDEQWAYIPRNALPYLKYLTETGYKHLYYSDGPIVLTDVSINRPSSDSSSGCVADYANCVKDYTAGSNWRTVLIGSMGLGGASAIRGDTSCTTGVSGTCVQTPILDPADSTAGVGYSSYFSFDVTNQYYTGSYSNTTLNAQPAFKWEFSPPGLGFATSGAVVVRVAGATNGPTKNGKWFAVMASGPTGPVDSSVHRFLGRSNQHLKIFVIDLGANIGAITTAYPAGVPFILGTNYWVLDSGIVNAFSGNILGGSVDADRGNASSIGYYQDDVIYVGYTRSNDASITSTTQWNTGGVLRILTKEDTNPANWSVSKVIDGIGPVTGAIDTLQDKTKKKFWLYFGTGRYYYTGDDSSSQRYIVGVQDRCYTTNNIFDKNCDTTAAPGTSPESTGKGLPLGLTDLANQSTSISSSVTKGWYIALRPEDTTNLLGAERMVSKPSAQSSGTVYYTSLQPTSDACGFGGTTYMWAVNYETGDLPKCSGLNGMTLIQMTTGAFEQVDFASIFNCKDNNGNQVTPPIPSTTVAKHITGGGGTTFGASGSTTDARSTGGTPGGGGGDPPPPRKRPIPRKEILHIKEK